MKFLRSAALAALVAVSGQAASAEDVINAVHFTPASTDFSKEFLRFVDAVNERGKGVVRIDVKGGPEVIPNPQLGAAQQSGLIDMLHTPAGLYLEIVPEGEAFAASTLPPSELRANGGWELLDGIYARKGNAKLLALLNASAGFHIWTVDEPKLTEDGMLDFTPLLIRASPLYKQFFENLGATLVIHARSLGGSGPWHYSCTTREVAGTRPAPEPSCGRCSRCCSSPRSSPPEPGWRRCSGFRR